jgi:hypothetical protein
VSCAQLAADANYDAGRGSGGFQRRFCGKCWRKRKPGEMSSFEGMRKAKTPGARNSLEGMGIEKMEDSYQKP